MTNRSPAAILPGATLGVFGSGQLGRMFAMAARRMGYFIHVFSPDSNTPTGQIADVEISAAYDDTAAIEQFARNVSVVTYEFENVPHAAIRALGDRVPVRPHPEALVVTQHRIREKEFLVTQGIPVTPFRRIQAAGDLRHLETMDFPAIMKTASSGYDGKGQVRVDRADEAETAWQQLGRQEVILERRVEFELELSVVGVRGIDGSFAHYGPLVNRHENHILDVSISGATLPARVETAAVEITRTVMEQLDVVGVICIEFFMQSDGELLVNELAPRPHNSGHLTIDAHVTCQFEQQVRTICGLPLGSPERLRPAAMANLLGDLWQHGEPRWDQALRDRDVKLHLYGKHQARPGRKMGHLTVLADTAEQAAARAVAARSALTAGQMPTRDRPVAS